MAAANTRPIVAGTCRGSDHTGQFELHQDHVDQRPAPGRAARLDQVARGLAIEGRAPGQSLAAVSLRGSRTLQRASGCRGAGGGTSFGDERKYTT